MLVGQLQFIAQESHSEIGFLPALVGSGFGLGFQISRFSIGDQLGHMQASGLPRNRAQMFFYAVYVGVFYGRRGGILNAEL